jgi:hypothetical protein
MKRGIFKISKEQLSDILFGGAVKIAGIVQTDEDLRRGVYSFLLSDGLALPDVMPFEKAPEVELEIGFRKK